MKETKKTDGLIKLKNNSGVSLIKPNDLINEIVFFFIRFTITIFILILCRFFFWSSIMSTTTDKDQTSTKEEYWYPLESDPTYWSDYLRSLTTGSSNGRYFIDIPSIDLVDEMGIFECHNIIAYIFLYQMKSYQQLGTLEPLDSSNCRNLFFMRQFVHNSCGSVALFHAYINTIASDKLNGTDSLIDRFYQENRDHTPEERGHSFATNSLLKQLHHDVSLHGQSELPSDEQLSKIDYHYVAFIPLNGSIFELDGRKSLPIIHQNDDQTQIDKDNFKRQALKIIKRYMQLDPNNLHYSLLALCTSSSS